jgi:glycosyltransferase involved in cell wall biosynthesis
MIVGPSVTEEERMYKLVLERLVLQLGLLDRVDVRGPEPHHAVHGLYADVDALVNDMREGATDKVVYEAAASCLPVIASNPAFDTLLPEELRFVHGDVEGLAAAIRRLHEIDRNAVGRGLRETVLREHTVDVWAERVVALAR